MRGSRWVILLVGTGVAVLVASCALALAVGRRAVRTGELVEVTQEFQLSSPVRSVTVLEDRWAEPVEAWVRGLALRRRVVEPVPWWAWKGVLPTTAWRVRWVYQNFLPPADAPACIATISADRNGGLPSRAWGG